MTRLFHRRFETRRAIPSSILLVDDDPFLSHARKAALERSFSGVERAASAAEAFIRMDDPEFARHLMLVIVGLHMPGLGGPSFVNELTARLPHTPVLVVGRPGEIAPDYAGEHVRFLPQHASTEDLLAGTCQMLATPQAKVA